MYDSFSSGVSDSDVYILTGVRESGKTVAMSTIFADFKKDNNWICVELNPENDMLEQLASKLYDEGKLKKLFLKTEFGFSFQGISFSISESEALTNISTLIKMRLS